MICSKCGNQVQDGARFCSECGATLGSECQSQASRELSTGKMNALAYCGMVFASLAGIDLILARFIGIDVTGFFPFTTILLSASACVCIWYWRSKLANQYLSESNAGSDGLGAIDAGSIQGALSSIKTDGSIKYVELFAEGANEKSIHGLKLSAGERPIILFGKNSKIGELTTLGWNGIVFTDRALYYKIYKYYANPILAGLGGQSVAKGRFDYASIKQLSIKEADDVYVYVNGAIIGRFVTTKSGADAVTVMALDMFCKNVMK